MPEKSFEARLAALETQMAGRTLETHLREQAELFDRMLAYRFEVSDKKWDEKLAAGLSGLEEKFDVKLDELEEKIDGKLLRLEERIDTKLLRLEERIETKLDLKLETKLEPLRADLKRLTDAVLAIAARLP